MTYFCFIESSLRSVPHMEPLLADDLDDAKQEAAELMGLHASGYAAHIFEDDERVATVRREGRTSPASSSHEASAT